MIKKRNIFLIGAMGAGKSTIGRQLARKLKRPFYDSDRDIESTCGVNIPTIFEYEGEDGFRQRETKVIETLSAMPGIVLATGGGAILSEENRHYLKTRGIVVYLQVSLKEQFERIQHDRNRPLLQTENPQLTLKKIMLERAPIYESLADMTINSKGRNSRSVLHKIYKRLQTFV